MADYGAYTFQPVVSRTNEHARLKRFAVAAGSLLAFVVAIAILINDDASATDSALVGHDYRVWLRHLGGANLKTKESKQAHVFATDSDVGRGYGTIGLLPAVLHKASHGVNADVEKFSKMADDKNVRKGHPLEGKLQLWGIGNQERPKDKMRASRIHKLATLGLDKAGRRSALSRSSGGLFNFADES